MLSAKPPQIHEMEAKEEISEEGTETPDEVEEEEEEESKPSEHEKEEEEIHSKNLSQPPIVSTQKPVHRLRPQIFKPFPLSPSSSLSSSSTSSVSSPKPSTVVEEEEEEEEEEKESKRKEKEKGGVEETTVVAPIKASVQSAPLQQPKLQQTKQQQTKQQQRPQQQQQQQQPQPQRQQRSFGSGQKNQGVQGPFGMFRGEALGSWSESLPNSLPELFRSISMKSMMIENWVKKRPVLVGDRQPLEKALQRLNRHKISSLPIIRENSKAIVGLLDCVDIINFLCSLLGQENTANLQKDFILQSTGHTLETCKKKPIIFSMNSNIEEALDYFTEGVARIMVFDCEQLASQELSQPKEGFLGLFTQFDVIYFLATNPYWLNVHPNAKKTLKELNLLEQENNKVNIIQENALTIEAFQLMQKTSSTCLAVVDSEGVIVATLSASNIRGISRRNFKLLRRPLYEFIQKDRRRGWWTLPICAQEEDTLEKTILQLTVSKLHNLFVLDENGKPKSLITLTDILRRIHNKA